MFLYNIKSRNIQVSITAFENEPDFQDQPCSTKVFFNHTSFDGGIIVAASDIAKEIKVFSRTVKMGYRLLFCVSLNFNDGTGYSDYTLHCISSRYNQILFFIAGTSGVTVYDLFEMSNKTIFALNDCGYDHPPYILMSRENNST